MFQVALIILAQFFQSGFSGFAVQSEVGLKLGEQAVLFPLHHFVTFVDGEVEGGYQLSIPPGLINVELIIELAIAWQEVNDSPYRGDKNQDFIEQIFVKPILLFIEINHLSV